VVVRQKGGPFGLAKELHASFFRVRFRAWLPSDYSTTAPNTLIPSSAVSRLQTGNPFGALKDGGALSECFLLLEFLRLRTGFELPSSWIKVPCYGFNRNRNILDFMRWSQIDLGAQDINGIQRPKSFPKK
jgi:hypothetical protein